ncbi:DDT domain-containing protein [Actinidia chinensis var. chinensis]|uniref:DDT domain-containing protein n=1 Tax=Actinidia chinensis var. chinensis TaxID=1590841 RepID=A0A2R6RLF8_ACTCC|nr:DDT domain-containing protein [Actinidia chinensis var. chinensis]
MPLYKRKPFPLAERPKDLKPQERVFQVRFTKEIFRDYGEYLNRINLYRQRIWTCKVTAKTNLTFEEALVSEKHATEKVQRFPKELVVPVLRDVQFSMLTLKDLANKIATKLQEQLSEGTELYGKRNNRVYPCKIIKVLAEEAGRTQYEVAWLDKEKKMTENAVVNGEDLVRKKLPFTRDVLKSFIRESTYRSVPWVLHDKLASKYGISTDPPEELRCNFSFQDGRVVRNRKRNRKEEVSKEELRKCKSKKMGNGKPEPWIPGEIAEDKLKKEPIKYPIDDILVQPTSDDPVFTERPSLSRDFQIPMDCVGDLLMIWDFCSSFSRLLHLWPFSLEDFEHALCHKDSNLIVIAESHSAILRLLIKDDRNYTTSIQKKKRKPKITLVTWAEYLCDFLEMIGDADLSNYITTVRRGHYGLLDIHAKLGIFRELVAQALTTNLMREKLDECIEQRQELAATRRGEALEEGRQRREDKELRKAEYDGKEIKGRSLKSVENSSNSFENGNHSRQNGDVADKWNKNALSPRGKHAVTNRKQADTLAKSNGKQHNMDAKAALENVKDSSKKGVQKLVRDDGKEAMERSNEQRKEYLEREMEKRFIRTNSLGKDRYHNRYWFFKRDGRIFIESSDSAQWGYYSTKEELDAFVGSLNRKGERERALKKQLEMYYDKICLEMLKRSKEVAHKIAMEEAVVRRSTRVRAPPRENPALAFLKYVNKWKED